MRVNTQGVYCYPWDIVGDAAAAGRLAGLGARTVTLAAAYHSVRAITPFHPAHRTVHAHHAAAYFALRDDVWRGGRLRPAVPNWGVPVADPFGVAADALRAAELDVEAWLVLTHNSQLGLAHPRVTVRNAFGERYAYALCPAQRDVRDYCRRLAEAVAGHYPVRALALEACGWLGFEHGSQHEKTGGADLGESRHDLLSVCLCDACAPALAKLGADPDALGSAIRAAVDAPGTGRGLAEVLGSDGTAALMAHRTSVIGTMLREIAEVTAVPVLLMAAAGPERTGAEAGIDLADHPGPLDGLILQCGPGGDQAVTQVKAAASQTSVPLIASVTALESDARTLPQRVRHLADAGAAGVRYYHGGLASAGRLDIIRSAVTEFTLARSGPG